MRTRLLPLIFLALLSACGFHLRGQGEFALPFQSLHVQSANAYTPFISELKSAIQATGVQLADSPDTAQLTLNIASEMASKQILSLSSAGRVREYQLRYIISFRAFDRAQREWLPAQEIVLLRNLPFDDTQVLAKEQEEDLLYQDMRADSVQQMLRRLNRAKPLAENKAGDGLEPSLDSSPGSP